MSDTTTAIIQARMGSTRLPGKVMLPLAGQFVLERVVHRVRRATEVDEVVVATSTEPADDIVEWGGERAGATVFRGDEQNVLDRMFRAAEATAADCVVRITADCPLVDPDVIDHVIRRLDETGADYSSNIIERTFSRGLDVEAFTIESFERVHAEADTPAEREHVTLYYRRNTNLFDIVNVTSKEVFDDRKLQGRTEIRLTLDVLADYLFLRDVFDHLEVTNPTFSEVIEAIDGGGVERTNATVTQKDPRN